MITVDIIRLAARSTLKILSPLSFRLLSGSLILSFHGITDKKYVDRRVQSNQMQVEEFKNIIRILLKHYRIISLDELESYVKKKAHIPKRVVVLTFDDGYQNNLFVVEPILKKLALPFSIFINTHNISKKLRLPSYIVKVALLYTERQTIHLSNYPEKMEIKNRKSRLFYLDKILNYMKSLTQNDVNNMIAELKGLIPGKRWEELNQKFMSEQLLTWEEIELLLKKGITIGSHGHEHCILHSNQSENEMRHQVETSKKIIEDKIGSCKHFAYPNGKFRDISPRAVSLLLEAGYETASTAMYGTLNASSSPLLLPRFSPSYKDIGHIPILGIRYNRSFQKHQKEILFRTNL